MFLHPQATRRVDEKGTSLFYVDISLSYEVFARSASSAGRAPRISHMPATRPWRIARNVN